MYCVTRNSEPNSAKNVSVTAALAAENRGLRKKPRFSIGCAWRDSHRMNAPSVEAAMTKAVSVRADIQPASGASMIAHSRAVRPAIDSTAPPRSSFGASWSRELGTTKTQPMMARMRTGRLTRKIEPHSKCSSNQPPVTGPSATPSPEQPAQIAIALARSLASRNTLVRIESVAGMMSAPPTPIRARQAISWFADPAIEATTDPTPKIAIPIIRAPRRPYLSPRNPAVSRSPAKTST